MSKLTEVQKAIAAIDGSCTLEAAQAAVMAMRTMTGDMLQAAVEVGPARSGRRNVGEQIKAEYDAAIVAASR